MGFWAQGKGNQRLNCYDDRDKYIPPGIWDVKSWTEEMFTKLMKGQKSQDTCIKELKVDASGLTQKVKSYSTAIK